jgi:hypothetical protein
MTRRAAALALLLGAVLAPGASADALIANSRITPHPARFGDVVHATVEVDGPAAATLAGGFAPFRVLRSSVTHATSASGVVTTWRFDLQCLDAVCAPGPGNRVVKLASARVRAGSLVGDVSIPNVVVAPRATAKQVASPEAAFRHPTAPVGPSYRFAPDTTRRVLFAGAALLVLVAAALLLPLVLRRRRTRAEHELDPLARALALVRASRTRPVPDRRRALGLLARTLRRRDRPAAARTSADLAWSEPEPEPERIGELADQVEQGAS